MREIEFRGLMPKSKTWIYGDINQVGDNYYVNDKEIEKCTLGQYIGQRDNLDRKIFEGDILFDRNDEQLTVIYVNAQFEFINSEGKNRAQYVGFKNLVVTGNIHTGDSLKDYIGKLLKGKRLTMRVDDVGYSGQVYGITVECDEDGQEVGKAKDFKLSALNFLSFIFSMEVQPK